MADYVNKILKINEDIEQKYLLIAGKGHMQYYNGIPERIINANP